MNYVLEKKSSKKKNRGEISFLKMSKFPQFLVRISKILTKSLPNGKDLVRILEILTKNYIFRKKTFFRNEISPRKKYFLFDDFFSKT